MDSSVASPAVACAWAGEMAEEGADILETGIGGRVETEVGVRGTADIGRGDACCCCCCCCIFMLGLLAEVRCGVLVFRGGGGTEDTGEDTDVGV